MATRDLGVQQRMQVSSGSETVVVLTRELDLYVIPGESRLGERLLTALQST